MRRSGLRRWLFGTANQNRRARSSTGTATTTAYGAGIRSRWPPTPWPATGPDVAVGKDALLLCDTTEMADALNRRIHDDTIDADAPTVTAARGHRIAEGDLMLSRRNDPTIDVWQATDRNAAADPVRNGDRWRVAAVDPATDRIAA